MEIEQFTIIKTLLEEIRDSIRQQELNQQPTTKITVVGNKPQTNSVSKAKGFNATDDFSF